MEDYLTTMIISPINNVCVIIVVAYILSHRNYYCEVIEGKRDLKNSLLFLLTFGMLSLYGAMAGGIANVRVLGPMLAGLLSGPGIGIGAALFSGAYRLFDLRYGAAEVTNSAILSTLLAGLAGGLVNKWKRGQLPRVGEAAIFAASFEVFHMILTLQFGQWQAGVVDIVRRFALPMTVAHTVGTAIFIWVTRNILDARNNKIEKENVQKELQKSEERFATAFNFNSNPMSIRTNDNGRYVTVNDSFLRTFEYSRDEVIGNTLFSLKILTDDYPKIVQPLQEGKPIRHLETHAYTKSGKLLTVLLFCETIDISGKPHTLSTFIDISERKKLEEEVLRYERLNLVGHMSTGIAHEIRNPLTTIRGFLQFLRKQKDLTRYNEYLDLSIQELDQIKALISELILLARTKAVEFKWMNLNTLIAELLPIIKAEGILFNKEVKVTLGNLPDLFIDEKEIKQFILNLAKNGMEAMADKGILTISTYTVSDEVFLSIQDQGSGIDADILKMIGTPFFTTKDTGLGLGLAVCYSIAERHQAAITIDTSKKGTTFLVRFKNSLHSLEKSACTNE